MTTDTSMLALVLQSQLLQPEWYSKQAKLHFDSLESAWQHYSTEGWQQRFDPSPFFSTGWYLDHYPDVLAAKLNPVQHYMQFGFYEGRSIRPELSEPALDASDEVFLSGDHQQAEELLQQVPHTSAMIAADCAFRQARLLFYRAEFIACQLLCQKLLATYSRYVYPAWSNELCRYRMHCLMELGQAEQARQCVLQQFDKLSQWSVGIEMYRHTVDSPASLAGYWRLLQPYIQSKGRQAGQALFLYAIAARKVRAYSEAKAALMQRFHLMLKQPGLFVPDAAESDGRVWQQKASIALKCLKEDFERLDQQFFLISGTLLGCVREQGFIAHDKDIDVGVMDDVALDSLAKQLRQSGRFLVQHTAHDKVLQVRHANGVLIDIFTHWQQDGLLHHSGQKTAWTNSPFTLTDTEFLGERYAIPATPERYLQENYGDWQTPKKNYDTFSDTPNMYVTNLDELHCYYLRMLPEYFVAGKNEQYRNLFRAYQRRFAVSWPMRLRFWWSLRQLKELA